LRNYVSTRFLQYNLHGDDGGGGTIDLVTTSAGRNDEELGNNVVENIAFQEQINDPTHIYTWTVTYPNPTTTVYWQLDSRNISTFANYLADFLYIGVVSLGNIPQLGICKAKLGTDYTPRKGWTDDAGVKRLPTPTDARKKSNFSGAAGLLEALNGLLKLASDLTAMREVRKASIVLYAYNQVIKQVWSITQAIQYLIDNRITATV